MGVLPTVVGPEQVLVMEQEVNTLLEKGAIEYVPPSNRETGFYSRYFIVPKKDGGLRPILDLRVLNEDHFFRRGLGFSVDAGAPVTATCRFHPCSCEKCKARPATHCQTVPETVGSSGESSQGPGLPASYSPALAGQSMVSRSCVPPRRASSGASCQEGPSVPSRGLNISPPPRTVEPVGLASEGAQLIESGLSTEVVETILQSRAPSTRKLYALKWRVFTSWCSDRRLDPVNCPIGTVLEFLQDRFTAGTCPATLKVYVAALSACHALVDGAPLGRHPLLSRFLRGARRLRPPARTKVPSWDLAIVLEGLVDTPFELIESASDKLLTLKMFFLMAITSLKRIGDMQALSISPSCLDFAPGMVKVILHPHPDYLPKVPFSAVHPVTLEAFCSPPFSTPEQERSHRLCPVRALQVYVHRTSQWRKSEQLFICYGGSNRGGAATKQTMSHWVRDAIALASEARGQASPIGLRAHSTRGVASSSALARGAPLQHVCDAAGWSSPHTFIRFYSFDVHSTPGSHVLESTSQANV
ncbi:hypothetical protein PO909_033810 [Leuciscus waleckii]